MQVVRETIIATSEGAFALNDTGSHFELRFDQPIMIPNNITSCSVRVDEATVWWTIPNISINLNNNKFYIEYLTIDYTVTIPNGLYSVSDLNNALDRELTTEIGVSGLISLEPDNATQKVSLTINVADVQLDFTKLDTFRTILGFDSQFIPVAVSTGPYTQLGDNVAEFNQIEYFLLKCDIISQGIRTNNAFSQTIAQILIDVAPGSQIVSREFNPPRSNGYELRGKTIDRIAFWLTDQNSVLVDTNGESFSCRMVIEYLLGKDYYN